MISTVAWWIWMRVMEAIFGREERIDLSPKAVPPRNPNREKRTF